MADTLNDLIKQHYPQTEKAVETTTIETEPVVPVEVKTETITETTTTEQPEFNIEHFNKRFGKEFKSEDELKSIFDLPTKVSELETKASELVKLKAEYEALQQKHNEVGKWVDPKKFFANEELYKTNLMLKKYPDKDISVMTKVSTMDVDKADNIDLLIMNELLQNPKIKGGEAGAKELVANELGIDLEDKTTWDQLAENKIIKAATKIREDFKNLQKVEADLPIDVDKMKSDLISQETSKFENNKKEWNPLINKALSDFKELTIYDKNDKGELIELYKYQVGWSDDVKKAIGEEVTNYLAYTGQPVNEKTILNALNLVKGRYAQEEQANILKAYALKETTRVNDEWHNKVNNDKPLSERTAPANETEKATQNWTNAINNI